MSSITASQNAQPMAATSDWSLWLRQIGAILRLEVKKNFWGRRALLMYLLAAVPVALFAALALYPETARDIRRSAESDVIFANLFEGLILRTIVFFGCAWVFMNLFRGEIVDKVCTIIFSRLCAAKCWSSANTSQARSPASCCSGFRHWRRCRFFMRRAAISAIFSPAANWDKR